MVITKEPADWFSKRSQSSWGNHDLAFVLKAFNLCRPRIHCPFILQTVRCGWDFSCKTASNTKESLQQCRKADTLSDGKERGWQREAEGASYEVFIPLFLTAFVLFSVFLPTKGKVLMWGIDSKGSSWKWGCEASYKGREQWASSWALQRRSHAVARVIALALVWNGLTFTLIRPLESRSLRWNAGDLWWH